MSRAELIYPRATRFQSPARTACSLIFITQALILQSEAQAISATILELRNLRKELRQILTMVWIRPRTMETG